ncbi:phage major capsid protein [Sphingorhabdus soli]|uniref:Phage major capsid protein n=1 Tax=Flavisphingopyxis soli TaxID=2601267 RepID=A0A5C6U5J3_9SPHN|nr:phage major capsid protein [Sphingorhabdus soli]TXC68183.1 phage major capsid protein [Sphingorhabdus soli]
MSDQVVETAADSGAGDPLVASFDAFAGAAGEGGALGERPMLEGVKAHAPARSAFTERYLRKGIDAGFEMKALTSLTGPEGGYAVPQEIDAKIDAILKDISPIRSLANVVATGTSGYRKLVATGGMASGWVAETAGRAETATPDFAEIAPPMGELYANPAASQAMLDDAMFDVEDWLAGEIAREFAAAEGAAFVAGSGIGRPKGFLTYPTADEGDATRAFGTIEHLATGVDGDFGSGADDLIDLVQSLRAPYRQGAAFVMNAASLGVIRKLKTADGAFLFQPSLAEGRPDTLLGYRIVEAEEMPDIGSDSLSIAFGNFEAGYIVADRGETAILRDPFTNKPFVHFYATKRVGGAVTNSEAIKLLKFGLA